MHRIRTIAVLAAVLVLSACQALLPGGPPTPESRTSAEASPSAAISEGAATAHQESPQPSQCFLGAGIADVVSDIRELARFADTISIAEVVQVGQLQYSTENGERPSCEYVQAAQGVFGVGRMIELQEQRNVAGRGRAAGTTFTYWLPGGTLGGDTSSPHHFGLETPQVGDRMLAFLMKEPGDMDRGPGVLLVDAYELFAIGRDGRIHTPNPQDNVTTESVDAIVDEVVPAP